MLGTYKVKMITPGGRIINEVVQAETKAKGIKILEDSYPGHTVTETIISEMSTGERLKAAEATQKAKAKAQAAAQKRIDKRAKSAAAKKEQGKADAKQNAAAPKSDARPTELDVKKHNRKRNDATVK